MTRMTMFNHLATVSIDLFHRSLRGAPGSQSRCSGDAGSSVDERAEGAIGIKYGREPIFNQEERAKRGNKSNHGKTPLSVIYAPSLPNLSMIG